MGIRLKLSIHSRFPLRSSFIATSILLTGSGLLQALMAQEPVIKDSVTNENVDFHFQFTTVTQYKNAIRSPYSGLRSLNPNAENATTLTSTLFFGRALWRNGAFYVNPEIAGGSGVSLAQGMGGFANGEAFRVGQPAPKIYFARLFLQHTIPLSDELTDAGLGANEVYKTKPVRYLDIVVGKFSLADYFDRNAFSHDPRSQFLNWSLMSAGAWDYPANVRGYTWGSVVELGLEKISFRIAAGLLPVVANGADLNRNFRKSFGTVAEFEKRYTLLNHGGTIRVLAFYNRGGMGNYRLATSGPADPPDVASTRNYGRTKYGYGINAEQNLSDHVGFFTRLSWNDGTNETWAFTEIDQSVSAGIVIDGTAWKRGRDRLGLAAVANGLSSAHRNYLNAGGSAFMLGDGKLSYGRETIAEIYYLANIFSQTFFVTPNLQWAINPGYNRDRGPAFFAALRVHVEF